MVMSWRMGGRIARVKCEARGVPVRFGGRHFEIIEVLVCSRPGERVTKARALSARVARRVCEDNTLQFHIFCDRKALGRIAGILKTAVGAWISPYWVHGHHDRRATRQMIRLISKRCEKSPGICHFRTNLLRQIEELIGRDGQCSIFRLVFSRYRVVTLTGTGRMEKPTGIGAARGSIELSGGCRAR